MKAIILAGGYAKRLWPLTKEQAKPLVDINGRPIISFILDKLDKSNITEIIISTNSKFQHDFEKWLRTQKYAKPVKIVVENSNHEGEKLGAIGGIRYVLEACNIDDDCLIISGDNFFDFDILTFISYYEKKRTVVNAVFDVGDAKEAKRLGVVVLEGERIADFVEKPEKPPTTLASTGCYLFPKETLRLFASYLNEGNNSDAPGFFLQWLHKRQPVHAFIFSTAWFDIGTPESLERVRRFVERGVTL
ncbi:MAG: nucleotidyltransferase family protein [Candidatus Aenigmarchaeota archaeon]|nr:nucleotidyltransferase family protein [Candidatus Aenigmarchaeota archaeon]